MKSFQQFFTLLTNYDYIFTKTTVQSCLKNELKNFFVDDFYKESEYFQILFKVNFQM